LDVVGRRVRERVRRVRERVRRVRERVRRVRERVEQSLKYETEARSSEYATHTVPLQLVYE
jgi:hypothetical protein